MLITKAKVKVKQRNIRGTRNKNLPDGQYVAAIFVVAAVSEDISLRQKAYVITDRKFSNTQQLLPLLYSEVFIILVQINHFGEKENKEVND